MDLLRRFVDRDYKALEKQLRKDCEKYFGYIQKERNVVSKQPAVVEQTAQRMIIDLANRWSGNWYWPWVEAAFAKLAILDGAHILRSWRVLRAGGGRRNPADARRLAAVVAVASLLTVAALVLGMVAAHVPQDRL